MSDHEGTRVGGAPHAGERVPSSDVKRRRRSGGHEREFCGCGPAASGAPGDHDARHRVRPGSDLARYPGLAGHDPAIMAALVWRDAVTRTDDAAVVVLVPAAPDRTAGAAGGRA